SMLNVSSQHDSITLNSGRVSGSRWGKGQASRQLQEILQERLNWCLGRGWRVLEENDQADPILSQPNVDCSEFKYPTETQRSNAMLAQPVGRFRQAGHSLFDPRLRQCLLIRMADDTAVTQSRA